MLSPHVSAKGLLAIWPLVMGSRILRTIWKSRNLPPWLYIPLIQQYLLGLHLDKILPQMFWTRSSEPSLSRQTLAALRLLGDDEIHVYYIAGIHTLAGKSLVRASECRCYSALRNIWPTCASHKKSVASGQILFNFYLIQFLSDRHDFRFVEIQKIGAIFKYEETSVITAGKKNTKMTPPQTVFHFYKISLPRYSKTNHRILTRQIFCIFQYHIWGNLKPRNNILRLVPYQWPCFWAVSYLKYGTVICRIFTLSIFCSLFWNIFKDWFYKNEILFKGVSFWVFFSQQ